MYTSVMFKSRPKSYDSRICFRGKMRYEMNAVDEERIRSCQAHVGQYESWQAWRSGLLDISSVGRPDDAYKWFGVFCHDCSSDLRKRFRTSSWFTRGWTLQELLAPREVVFFDIDWHVIGTRRQLAAEVATTLKSVTAQEMMSWKPDRIKRHR